MFSTRTGLCPIKWQLLTSSWVSLGDSCLLHSSNCGDHINKVTVLIVLWSSQSVSQSVRMSVPLFYNCTVINSIVLYCIVLYCTVINWTLLYCSVLYCTVLYCIVLYCTVLYCTVLYCTVLYYLPNIYYQTHPSDWPEELPLPVAKSAQSS